MQEKKQKQPAPAPANPLEALLQVAGTWHNIPAAVPWDADVFGRQSQVPLYIYMADAIEVGGGEQLLNISVIQFWMM